MDFDLKNADSIEGVVDELSDLSFVKVPVVIDIVSFPDVIDPLQDGVEILADSMLNNVEWILLLLVADEGEGETHGSCDVELVWAIISCPEILDDSVETEEQTQDQDDDHEDL